jgi:hypothetical protein
MFWQETASTRMSNGEAVSTQDAPRWPKHTMLYLQESKAAFHSMLSNCLGMWRSNTGGRCLQSFHSDDKDVEQGGGLCYGELWNSCGG